jgi:hypothetical protein
MIKYYVYQLIDPINKQPFYIGKAEGSSIKNYHNIDPKITRSTKVIIDAIKLRGVEVLVEVVKDNMDEVEALLLEAQLIKKYGRRTKDVGGILTNAQSNGALSKPGKNIEYSTIQVPVSVKEQINDYCNRKGYKIGRFIETLFLNAVSGSTTNTAFTLEQ